MCFQVIRLPWNKTVSQGGLASLASSIIKQLHGNVSTVSMEVMTSNKGGQKILLNGYMYTKKVTRLTGIWWSCVCARHRGIRNRVLTNQRDRSYVYAAVSLAADCHFVGGHIVTYIFSRVSVGSACVRVWKRDCDVTSLVEHRVKGLQQNGL